MSHLWIHPPDDATAWGVLTLDGDGCRYHLTGAATQPVRRLPAERIASDGALLVSGKSAARDGGWVLLVTASMRGVRVNGQLPLAGIRVLMDRDEVRVGNVNLFYSTEAPARVEPFPGAAGPVKCPRCHTSIAKHQPAVRCPVCGVWHHESDADELACWTYQPRCASCGHATEMNAGFQWTPGEIESP